MIYMNIISNINEILCMLDQDYCKYLETLKFAEVLIGCNSCNFVDNTRTGAHILASLQETWEECIPPIYIKYVDKDCKNVSVSLIPKLPYHNLLVKNCVLDIYFCKITKNDTLATIYEQYDMFLSCITDPGGNDIPIEDALIGLKGLCEFLKAIIKLKKALKTEKLKVFEKC